MVFFFCFLIFFGFQLMNLIHIFNYRLTGVFSSHFAEKMLFLNCRVLNPYLFSSSLLLNDFHV